MVLPVLLVEYLINCLLVVVLLVLLVEYLLNCLLRGVLLVARGETTDPTVGNYPLKQSSKSKVYSLTKINVVLLIV